jgi:hypothetical protein
LVNPDGGATTSTFDALSRPYVVQKPDGYLYTSAFDPNGRKTTFQLGLGSTRKYSYDNGSRLTTQVELNAALSPIVTLIDTYDAVSNRLSRSNNGNLTSWSYDNDYRLLYQHGAIGPATFAYDSMSNVLVKWHYGQARYFQDLLNNIVYARLRFLRVALGRWQTADLFWPNLPTYEYAGSSPANDVDPFGLVTCEQFRNMCFDAIDANYDRCRSLASLTLTGTQAFCKRLPKYLVDGCLEAAQIAWDVEVSGCLLQKDNFKL